MSDRPEWTAERTVSADRAAGLIGRAFGRPVLLAGARAGLRRAAE